MTERVTNDSSESDFPKLSAPARRALIETEADLKYRKKYAGVWKAK